MSPSDHICAASGAAMATIFGAVVAMAGRPQAGQGFCPETDPPASPVTSPAASPAVSPAVSPVAAGVPADCPVPRAASAAGALHVRHAAILPRRPSHLTA